MYGIIHLVRTENFPKNQHFLPPDTHTYVRAYQGVRNVGFSENLACFVFLKHPFWDFRPFALLSTIYLLSRIYLKRGSVLWPAQECNSSEKDLLLKITSSLIRFQGYLIGIWKIMSLMILQIRFNQGIIAKFHFKKLNELY